MDCALSEDESEDKEERELTEDARWTCGGELGVGMALLRRMDASVAGCCAESGVEVCEASAVVVGGISGSKGSGENDLLSD